MLTTVKQARKHYHTESNVVLDGYVVEKGLSIRDMDMDLLKTKSKIAKNLHGVSKVENSVLFIG